jgi:RNA polymerase sigma factor (sigma-70 family)
MMYAEYLQLLYAQVNELPDRCREVFRLYFFEQRTTREIADLLNITEQTVRNQKTKAVHLLRALLLKRSAPAYLLLVLLFALDE